MQPNDPIQQESKQMDQQVDIHSYPIPIRIKHPSWSVRKGTYQQILYYLKNISTPNEQILISGTAYTIDTLLPYFEMLVQQKHASVLLKGLQCVEQILKLDKKLSSKHCIKTLIDKGIEYFPLLSQQRKGILEKFLDVLQLSRVESGFLKNKLNLPHEKSVMYVIEVIGVLNVTQLKGVLIALSKKHQKKCVRELAAEIAEQLQAANSNNQLSNNNKRNQQQSSFQKPPATLTINSKPTSKPNLLQSTCKLTIQKLPHYEQLPSKKQQQYSHQLVQKISFIIQQYTLSQLPGFSHVLRLMIDDNNHIVNVNAIKIMIKIFQSQTQSNIGININSNKTLIPQSFPLLFIFNKFKSHKTHPINSLLLTLVQAILKSTTNRVTDLLLAINEGLTCTGSKANVKFGCALTFFRIISVIYQNQDLYLCTTNENIQDENQDLQQKFTYYFNKVKFTKNQAKLIQKIIATLQKDKKYDTQMYLIRHAIGLLEQINCYGTESKEKGLRQYESSSRITATGNNNGCNNDKILSRQKTSQPNSIQTNIMSKIATNAHNTKSKTVKFSQKPPLAKTLTQSKSTTKFTEINLQSTLNIIIKSLNQPHTTTKSFTLQQKKSIKSLLQKSTQEFYACAREKRYEMFYLCELLQSFISNYIINQQTIEEVSEYLINLLKIISLLKPMITPQSLSFKEIGVTNVSQLLMVGLCRLAIGQQIEQVLQNLNTNYGYEIIFQSLQSLFILTPIQFQSQTKIKKKNKKHLIQWLQFNTPSIFLNSDYYKLIEVINQSKKEKKQIIEINTNKKQQINKNQPIMIGSQKSVTESPLEQQPKLKQTPTKKNNNNPQSQSIGYQRRSSPQQYEPLQSSRKKHLDSQLQDMNLSKIENNPTESNYYDSDYMEKSSFHQNIEQQLKQISTQRSDRHQDNIEEDISREYLKGLDVDKFKKKDLLILKEDEEKVKMVNVNEKGKLLFQPLSNNNKSYEQEGLRQIGEHDEQQQYMSKFKEVEQRRLQRERERREFMQRMKCEYNPVMATDNKQTSYQNISQSHHSDDEQNNSHYNDNESSQQSRSDSIDNFDNRQKSHDFISNDKRGQQQQRQQHQQSINPTLLPSATLSPTQRQQQLQSKPITPISDQSFLSTNSTGEFKYKFINQQKLSYMLKSTTNPYPHLRTLVLIPFKSSPKKHHFLQQLFHFYTHHVEFKIPQPYTGLVLLTILMFSQIKQDKTLIQPLQSLYELVAKQSTTNQFLRTIITLFHTVIQETLLINRRFLITILLKSMIRMLPFIEDGLSLLRDIQQFYQIGQMVYFEMFQQEYRQIKGCLQEEGVHGIVEKALQEEGGNLRSIVQGWLATGWKTKVIQTIEEFHQQQQSHEDNHQQCHEYQHEQQQHNYQSYI